MNTIDYNSEIVYGGIDGLLTTFAIIAGSTGATFSSSVITVLAISNVFADGFSMGVSSYLAERLNYTTSGIYVKNPIMVGLYTFMSFVTLGIIPVIPYIIQIKYTFEYSCVLLGIILFVLGYIRGRIIDGVITVLIGGITALISMYVAKYISRIVNNNNDEIND